MLKLLTNGNDTKVPTILLFFGENVSYFAGKKGSEISKGQSEAINGRRTDNVMTNRKGTKGQTTIYKALLRKLKIEKLAPH